MVRLVTFGYLRGGRTLAGLPRRDPSLRPLIEAFAQREGFVVAQVFTDVVDAARRWALESLIEAATFTDIAAVLVPDWSHLGSDRAAQFTRQQMIVDVTGVPVLAAQTDSPHPRHTHRPTVISI